MEGFWEHYYQQTIELGIKLNRIEIYIKLSEPNPNRIQTQPESIYTFLESVPTYLRSNVIDINYLDFKIKTKILT